MTRTQEAHERQVASAKARIAALLAIIEDNDLPTMDDVATLRVINGKLADLLDLAKSANL